VSEAAHEAEIRPVTMDGFTEGDIVMRDGGPYHEVLHADTPSGSLNVKHAKHMGAKIVLKAWHAPVGVTMLPVTPEDLAILEAWIADKNVKTVPRNGAFQVVRQLLASVSGPKPSETVP
jgi:hypothetical protein